MFYLLSLVKGQQGVEQTHHQVLMLAEYLLKSQVSLRVEVFSFYPFHHSFTLFFGSTFYVLLRPLCLLLSDKHGANIHNYFKIRTKRR